MSQSFEDLLARIRALPASPGGDARWIEWFGTIGCLGISLQGAGGIEVFVRGAPLQARSQLVERHLRHDDWRQASGAMFQASRIVLPSDDHFMAFAAFLAEEFFRLGVEEDRQASFDAVEPLLEMALRGNALPTDVQIGLIGELLVLVELLEVADGQAEVARCVEAWKGYQNAVRDFAFPEGIEVEVKTTRGLDSTHPISRLSQIDPHRTPAGVPTEQLFLVSLGVNGGDDASGVGIPGLVERILSLLGEETAPGDRNGLQELFLSLVERYGGEGRGYLHDQMKSWGAYAERWEWSFDRVYDMNDPELQVLRKSDIEHLDHILADTVRLSVHLPIDSRGLRRPIARLKEWTAKVGREVG